MSLRVALRLALPVAPSSQAALHTLPAEGTPLLLVVPLMAPALPEAMLSFPVVLLRFGVVVLPSCAHLRRALIVVTRVPYQSSLVRRLRVPLEVFSSPSVLLARVTARASLFLSVLRILVRSVVVSHYLLVRQLHRGPSEAPFQSVPALGRRRAPSAVARAALPFSPVGLPLVVQQQMLAVPYLLLVAPPLSVPADPSPSPRAHLSKGSQVV